MNNTNPLRPLEFQDNAAATQTNLRQIKQRWNQLVAHLPNAFASINTGSNNSAAIAAIQAEISELAAEIAALEAPTTYTVATPVSLGDVVYENSPGTISRADVATLLTAKGILGLAKTAGVSGNKIQVVESGSNLTNPGWSWTVGPVYIGLNGKLTQTPLITSGAVFQQLIGYATSATSVLVMLGQPIFYSSASSSFITVNPDGTLGVGTVSASSGVPRLVSAINGYTVQNNIQVPFNQQLRVAAGGSVRTYGTGTMKWTN